MLENVYAGLHVALVGNHRSVYFFPIYVRVYVCMYTFIEAPFRGNTSASLAGEKRMIYVSNYEPGRVWVHWSLAVDTTY